MTLIDSPTMTGIAQRSSTFRFELLNKDLLIQGVIEVNMDRPPTIDNNINRTIKRKMSNFIFPRSQAVDVNMLSDRVQVQMILPEGIFPLGVFMFADPSVARSTGGDWVDASLVDQGLMLDQAMANIYSLPPGSNITDAIIERLSKRLISNVSVQPSSLTTGTDWVTWPAGTSDMEVLNDLCEMAGYYSIFFNNSGVAVAKAVPNMITTDPDFVYKPGTSVYADTVTESNNLLDAPNRYIVVNNGLSDAPVSGFWDIPDIAPHSFVNRGMRVATVIDSQSVATEEQATAMAMAIGQSDTSTYEWAALSTVINPLHDTFNIVEWDERKYHEQEWSFTCIDGADHRHGLRRVYG